MTVSNPFHLNPLARVQTQKNEAFFCFASHPAYDRLDSHSINHNSSLSLSVFLSILFIEHLLIGLQQNSRYVLQIQCSVFNVQCVVCE